MSYSATVYRVMIASPSDVAEEREIVRNVLHEWNSIHSEQTHVVFLPVGWETHASPEMGDRPQASINKQILDDCDLLVGVFWTRIGSSTGEYASGTVEEIELHMQKKKKTLLYFSSAAIHPEKLDSSQYAELKQFKDFCATRGLFSTYATVEEFKEQFRRHWQQTIKDLANPQISGEFVKVPVRGPSSLSSQAREVLKEAAKDSDGLILRLKTVGEDHLITNGRNFCEDNSARSRAQWDAVLKELEQRGFIKAENYKREAFHVTDKGYSFQD